MSYEVRGKFKEDGGFDEIKNSTQIEIQVNQNVCLSYDVFSEAGNQGIQLMLVKEDFGRTSFDFLKDEQIIKETELVNQDSILDTVDVQPGRYILVIQKQAEETGDFICTIECDAIGEESSIDLIARLLPQWVNSTHKGSWKSCNGGGGLSDLKNNPFFLVTTKKGQSGKFVITLTDDSDDPLEMDIVNKALKIIPVNKKEVDFCNYVLGYSNAQILETALSSDDYENEEGIVTANLVVGSSFDSFILVPISEDKKPKNFEFCICCDSPNFLKNVEELKKKQISLQEDDEDDEDEEGLKDVDLSVSGFFERSCESILSKYRDPDNSAFCIQNPYKELMAYCKSNTIKYKDSSFQLTQDSVCQGSESMKKGITIERMNDVYPDTQAKVFVKGTSFNDVNQGGIGDCWLIGGLAAAAKHGYIENKIQPKQYNPYGFYVVKLYISHDFIRKGTVEKWRYVVIDSYLPLLEKELMFATSKSKNEFWICIVEKAIAKAFGGYLKLQGGASNVAQQYVTGGVSFQKFHYDIIKKKKQEDYWKLLMKLTNQHALMGTGASSEFADQFKLVKQHAYSVLGVKEYKNLRFVQVRNPWGWFEWSGKWNDKDSSWTEEIKEAVGFEEKDDGAFFLSFDDFLKYFSSLNYTIIVGRGFDFKIKQTISFVNNWDPDYERFGIFRKFKPIPFTIIHKTTNVLLKLKLKTEWYGKYLFGGILAKKDKNGYFVEIEESVALYRSICIEKCLEPGNYFFFPTVKQKIEVSVDCEIIADKRILKKEELEDSRYFFNSFDENGDGSMSISELGSALQSMGENPTQKEIEELMEEHDNGDGYIKFEEFLGITDSFISKKNDVDGIQELERAFRAFDGNGDGFIDVGELKQAMIELGEPLTEEETTEMLSNSDINEDGKLNFEEFIKLMKQ